MFCMDIALKTGSTRGENISKKMGSIDSNNIHSEISTKTKCNRTDRQIDIITYTYTYIHI